MLVATLFFPKKCDEWHLLAAELLEKRSWGNVGLHLGNESHCKRVFRC